MSSSKVHRVRYYSPKPEPINCISFNKSSKLIAVARGDASIEIWDLSHAPFLVNYIPGVKNGSVEALGWVSNRLLSTGLGGALIEWDLEKLCTKTTVLLTGYAAWCLDVNSSNTLVAIGTEQGYVNLYSVENDEIVYKKLFDKQEGRILCCKFDSTGNTLVTGSVDNIRVWNVETGHAISRMLVSRRGKETIVWCVEFLSDNTIVSGDSHGRLTFWDGTLGEQIETYTTHKADILSIAVSDDETKLYCSGVDPVITQFYKVEQSSGKHLKVEWVKNVQRNIHEHDVRGLVINGKTLISVGVDGYLTFSSYPPKWVMRVPPMIPDPRSSVCCGKKLLLLRYSNHLEVWKLGNYVTKANGKLVFSNISTKSNTQLENKNVEEDSTIAIINEASKNHKQKPSLKLTDNPVKLVSIKTKGAKQIRCCEMSPSGEFIVYSTDSDIRILKLEIDDEDQSNTSLSKVLITGVSTPCDRIAFTDDSRTMVVYYAGTIHILQVDPEAGATVVQTISTDKYLKAKPVLHLTVSKTTPTNEAYLVVADTVGSISVWVRKTKKFEPYVTLPKYRCVPSAITVDSARQTLIAVYVDQKIIEYDLAKKSFKDWPGAGLPVAWNSRKSAVVSIQTHPSRDALMLRDETSLWIIEKNISENQNTNDEPVSKKASRNMQGVLPLRIIPMKYLAGFHWLKDDEAVAVEIPPINIVSQLPPVLANTRKRNTMA